MQTQKSTAAKGKPQRIATKVSPTSKGRSKSPWHSTPYRTEAPRQKSWLDVVR